MAPDRDRRSAAGRTESESRLQNPGLAPKICRWIFTAPAHGPAWSGLSGPLPCQWPALAREVLFT